MSTRGFEDYGRHVGAALAATKVNLKPTTRVTYEILLYKHVLPAWRDTSLSGVTHEGVAP